MGPSGGSTNTSRHSLLNALLRDQQASKAVTDCRNIVYFSFRARPGPCKYNVTSCIIKLVIDLSLEWQFPSPKWTNNFSDGISSQTISFIVF